MKELTINNFNFIEYNQEPYITGIEICRKLDYKNPKDQAQKIWLKYSEYLKENAVDTKTVSTDGKYYKTRCYNESGALFFIAKCNIKSANLITKEIIKAFITIKNLIYNDKIEYTQTRQDSKIIRKELTDAIKNLIPESPHKSWLHKNYTDLIYKIMFGKNAKKIREDLNIPINSNLRDKLDKDSLEKIIKYENAISGLINIGLYEYDKIKSIISNIQIENKSNLLTK
jgi:prophage antirepressor-like protein